MTCPYCHSSFTVDPDDTSVYQIGKFDLTSHSSSGTRASEFFRLKNSENLPAIQRIIPVFLFIMLFLYLWKSSVFGCVQQNSGYPEIENKSSPPKTPDQNSEDKKPWVDI